MKYKVLLHIYQRFCASMYQLIGKLILWRKHHLLPVQTEALHSSKTREATRRWDPRIRAPDSVVLHIRFSFSFICKHLSRLVGSKKGIKALQGRLRGEGSIAPDSPEGPRLSLWDVYYGGRELSSTGYLNMPPSKQLCEDGRANCTQRPSPSRPHSALVSHSPLL